MKRFACGRCQLHGTDAEHGLHIAQNLPDPFTGIRPRDEQPSDVPTMAEAKSNAIIVRFISRAIFRTAIAAILPIAAEFFPVVAHWLVQYGWWAFILYVLSIVQALGRTIREFGKYGREV